LHTIKYLVVHCSDSPNYRDSVDAPEIHRWHIQRGFDGIGYHFVILRNGILENGRPIYWQGAHCEKVNYCSLGICLVGKDEFTQEQMDELAKLLAMLTAIFPKAEVKGHYQFDDRKTCPNFDVEKWWKGVRNG